MAISVDPNTGWSKPLIASKSTDTDLSLDSTYRETNSSWFTDSWWLSGTTVRHVWAKKFTNITSTNQRLLSASFNVCPGHSNGKKYGAESNNEIVERDPVSGSGCIFAASIYLEGNPDAVSENQIELNGIDKYNCSYGGVAGNTSLDTSNTAFGNPDCFVPGTASGVDSQGHLRYLHPEVFTFEDSPVLLPGQSIFLVIHVIRFTGSGNGLLRILGHSDNWQSEFDEGNTDYIWRYVKESDGTKHWVKDRSAFMYMGQTEGWAKLT